jgi:hypothetical protein
MSVARAKSLPAPRTDGRNRYRRQFPFTVAAEANSVGGCRRCSLELHCAYDLNTCSRCPGSHGVLEFCMPVINDIDAAVELERRIKEGAVMKAVTIELPLVLRRLGDPAKVSCGHGLGVALAHRGVSGRRDPGQVHAYFQGSSTADRRAGICVVRNLPDRSMMTSAKRAATASSSCTSTTSSTSTRCMWSRDRNGPAGATAVLQQLVQHRVDLLVEDLR